jgi:AraC family transcriptional activator of pobA
LKGSIEIPLYRLSETVVYAADSDDVNLGEFGLSHRIDFFVVIWFLENADLHTSILSHIGS